MKCPLRLRGITIPGCRPASEWCRRQQHRDWSEAKSGHAAVSYAATDCEAKALFSFLKTEIAWSFLDLTGTSMWAGGTQGCTHTPSKNKQHLHLRTCTFTCTLLYSHTGIYLQPHSCTVTFFPLLSSHSVPSCDSLTPACNPICPDLCHSVSFTHSVF